MGAKPKQRWVDLGHQVESGWDLEGSGNFPFGFGEAELNKLRPPWLDVWLVTREIGEPQLWEYLQKPETGTDNFCKSL